MGPLITVFNHLRISLTVFKVLHHDVSTVTFSVITALVSSSTNRVPSSVLGTLSGQALQNSAPCRHHVRCILCALLVLSALLATSSTSVRRALW